MAKSQTHRKFMIGLALGKDGIELWRFSESERHQHSGVFPLNWDQGDTGWQVVQLAGSSAAVSDGPLTSVSICVE